MDSRKGIWMCPRLLVSYCKHSGSSQGMREFIDTQLPALKAQFPHLEVDVKVRAGQHPHLEGYYRNGVKKPIGVKNRDSVRILEFAKFLVSQWGGKKAVVHGAGRSVRTEQPSLQGMWTPYLNRPSSATPK